MPAIGNNTAVLVPASNTSVKTSTSSFLSQLAKATDAAQSPSASLLPLQMPAEQAVPPKSADHNVASGMKLSSTASANPHPAKTSQPPADQSLFVPLTVDVAKNIPLTPPAQALNAGELSSNTDTRDNAVITQSSIGITTGTPPLAVTGTVAFARNLATGIFNGPQPASTLASLSSPSTGGQALPANSSAANVLINTVPTTTVVTQADSAPSSLAPDASTSGTLTAAVPTMNAATSPDATTNIPTPDGVTTAATPTTPIMDSLTAIVSMPNALIAALPIQAGSTTNISQLADAASKSDDAKPLANQPLASKPSAAKESQADPNVSRLTTAADTSASSIHASESNSSSVSEAHKQPKADFIPDLTHAPKLSPSATLQYSTAQTSISQSSTPQPSGTPAKPEPRSVAASSDSGSVESAKNSQPSGESKSGQTGKHESNTSAPQGPTSDAHASAQPTTLQGFANVLAAQPSAADLAKAASGAVNNAAQAQNASTPSSGKSGASAAADPQPAEAKPLSVVQAARLIERAGQSELYVGFRAGDFGNVDIRTSMVHNQIRAEISVEHSELHSVLAGELTHLEEKLVTHQVTAANIALNNQSGGGSADSRHAYRQGAPAPPTSTSGPADSETIPANISLADPQPGSAQLDIHM
jgi:hypothetical protein